MREKFLKQMNKPVKGDTPYPKEAFIKLEDINYDSPQLLKKALKSG